MILLDNLQSNAILSGNQDGNTLTVSGINTINKGNIGYINIINNDSSSINVLNVNSLEEYNIRILDLNSLISDIGNLDYVSYNSTDVGSISTAETPLPPGNYLFNNPVTFDTTLYLSGNGQYIFYFMSTFTISDPPIGNYMNLTDDINCNNIFFYSPYDILLNTSTSNSTLYGNFISDLNVLDTSTIGNFIINGKFLSSTGNISISGTSFIVSEMPQPVIISLASSTTFGVLASISITNIGNTTINGDIGVSPGLIITGFPPGTYTGSEYINDTTSSTAQTDASSAFLDGQSRIIGDGSIIDGLYVSNIIPGADLSGQDLGGLILPGGVYRFSSSANLTGTLTLDWNNDSTSIWIFQIGLNLTTDISSVINMINIPSEIHSNPVFWIVENSTIFGLGSTILGVMISSVSISDSGNSSTGPLLALNGTVSLNNTITNSYSNSSVTGADPHIIALDGSRLDVYEPGIYRIFDSNSNKRLIINAEIIRIGDADMYDKFMIIYPNGDKTLIVFKNEDIEVNGISHNSKKWSLKYIEHNNNYYIIEIELEFRSFLIRTNIGTEAIKCNGLLTGKILNVDSLESNKINDNPNFITFDYYKHNALLCGAGDTHVVKFNKEMIRYEDPMLRLFQDEQLIINR